MITNLEKAKRNIEYFVGYGCGHNKNLTKEQMYKLEQVYETLKEYTDIRKILNQIYLEYVNQYLTIENMALNENLYVKDLKTLIELGKKINNKEYFEKESEA